MMLPIIGIIIVVLYMICDESCAYLKGTVIGLPLEYLGIAYMGMVLISNLLKKSDVSRLLLSAGLGVELRLLGFQIQNKIFCSYCLSFGAVVLLLFLMNFEKSKKVFMGLSLVLGLILFAIFFRGSATPAYADDIVIPAFGNGKTQVRLYTDYFCKPCKALEPAIEPVIIDLVNNENITITFIDTPIHPQTTLFAKYFLYIVHENNDFKHALYARKVLFEAAREKIKDSEALEAFIKEKGMKFKSFDTKATFNFLSDCLKKDKINATPTCVIYRDGKRVTFKGYQQILEALKRL